MKLLKKLKKTLLYAGATPEEYAHILPDIRRNNHRRMQVFSCVAIAFLALMTVITYADKTLHFRYQTYLVPMLIFVLVFLAETFAAGKHPYLSKGMIYLFISLLALLAIAIGTVENREQTAGTFLAFLLVIPLLFVLRPIENVCFIAFFDLVFIFMSASVKNSDLFRVDMINALVFGCISINISSFMMTVSVENFVIKNALTLLAETDQLTQLQNRTGYERHLHIYPTLCQKNLACIYADVNGLHELNEAKGHNEGDVMLRFIADALKEQFGDFYTYRIGGDEYVAFAVDTDAAAVEAKLKALSEKLERKNYYVSAGYEIRDVQDIEISELVKAAEDKMYRAKQQFYGQNPAERRRHFK